MSTRVRPIILASSAAAITAAMTASTRADDFELTPDSVGDAVVRRTDAGNDGALNPGSTLPDVMAIAIGYWDSPTPASNPFNGNWNDDDSELLRVDILFDGLVNPPGPLALTGPTYDPFRYGPSPVYGFLEMDFDEILDTGGEIETVDRRFLGNVARFGSRPQDALGDRIAENFTAFDGDLTTPPFVERSGEEAHLALCGCDDITITNRFGDTTPQTFDAGDTWIISGRLLHRTHAFSEYSFAFGGSGLGDYDPIVHLQFEHDLATDRTMISWVFAITMQGAADLADEPEQSADLNASNHASIEEMIFEMRFAAQNAQDPGPGTAFDLLRDWGDEDHEETEEYLQVTDWELNGLFGTAYLNQEPDAYYVWTDVIHEDLVAGDLNGDGSVDENDHLIVMANVDRDDGQPRDVDGLRNGQVVMSGFGLDFELADIDYDGVVGPIDLALLGYELFGDANLNGRVDKHDAGVVRLLNGVTDQDIAYNPAADLDGNGVIDFRDLRILARLLLRGIGPG